MNALQFKRFDELVESCGNRYLATKLVSKWAREFGKQYKDSCLPESKLLEWVVTGKCPYTQWELLTRQIWTKDDELDNFLCDVLDEAVCNEVRTLYGLSIRKRHLTLSENQSLSNGQLARVNILLRMIWFMES